MPIKIKIISYYFLYLNDFDSEAVKIKIVYISE